MNDTTSIDSLLDSSLDDLADLPEFKVFPAGAHRVTINFEKKEINKHPAIELKLVMLETVELSDSTEEAPAAGTESSVAFMLDNEFGVGKFKEILKPLAEHFGVTQVSQILEAAKGAECLVVTKIRQNKEKTASYLDVVKLQVL
jgi:hypothetical protein